MINISFMFELELCCHGDSCKAAGDSRGNFPQGVAADTWREWGLGRALPRASFLPFPGAAENHTQIQKEITLVSWFCLPGGKLVGRLRGGGLLGDKS